MSDEYTVRFPSGGYVSLEFSGNLFVLPPLEREFVFALVDQIRAFEEWKAAQAKGQFAGSDSSALADAPKSEPPTQQEVERPAGSASPVGAPSAVSPEGYELGAGFSEFLHAVGHGPLDDAPAPARKVSLVTGAPVANQKVDGAPSSETVPAHFYICLTCGYEAAGPATLDAHQRVHVVPPPPPDTRKTSAGLLSSNMTPEEEARWTRAMKSGAVVTDDGPSPVDVPEGRQAAPANHLLTVGPPPDPDRVCRFCQKECGSAAARNTHQSLCPERPRPMAKPESNGHAHRWKMDPPNGPIIRGRCACGATREDPASPEPIMTSAQKLEKAYPKRPMVKCEHCGREMSGTQALASHMRGTHPGLAPAGGAM